MFFIRQLTTPARRRVLVRTVVLGLSALVGAEATAAGAWAREGSIMFADEIESGAIGEGIVTRDGVSFLVVDAPGRIDAARLRRALPRSGARLPDGAPFTVLAIGDSVTATGPYPELVAKLLSRATGNLDVKVARAAYSGKSVDAAVRRWARDGGPAKADLALIMFGLNDQATGGSENAYREQLRWLVERVREGGGDVVLMEPTPHIEPPPTAAARASVFRTANFAAAVRELGAELDVPVASTFDAIWGAGGETIPDAARAMWPLFPTHYSKPFTSLVATNGAGDTIHPNAAGHLRLARAVMNAIAGETRAPSPVFSASSAWAEDGRLLTTLRITNLEDAETSGRLDVYPYVNDDRYQTFNYKIGPGGSVERTVVWPGVARAEDLLSGAAGAAFGDGRPRLQVVDVRDGRSRVVAVPAPLRSSARWVRERRVAAWGELAARLRGADGAITTMPVSLSEEPQAGETRRVPLLARVANGGDAAGRVAGELFLLRYAEARTGEAVADGNLAEWSEARWARINAESRDAFVAEWALRAGGAGVWAAFRAAGATADDAFTMMFDPRAPEQLGTAGPYTWVDGKFGADGRLVLRAGDSSPAGADVGLAGRWRRGDDDGLLGELFIPYAVLGVAAWPESGDLGLSLVWGRSSLNPDDTRRMSRLYWSAERHPWNTLEFGVVRRDPREPTPFVLRIR